jgi:glycosyltransferase involved in cell wall biosynthesis
MVDLGMKKVKILVVGQTPPPFMGQAIMIQKMLETDFGDKIKLLYVPMVFSKELGDMKKFRVRKVFEVINVIAKIISLRVSQKPDVLYYPPSGASNLPVLRDVVILISTRWLFRKTIFHFHAGGLGDYYDHTNPVMRFLCRQAYFNPDAAIHISKLSPPDGYKIKAKRIFIVPNGIEDVYTEYQSVRGKNIPVILYVGALYESKGVLNLIEACRILKARSVSFQVKIIGQGDSLFEKGINEFLILNQLNDEVALLGIRIGHEKWKEYAMADIFCFPTYFEAETFGVVLVEAMMFGLPTVATRWRGIPSVVRDLKDGFLVPIKKPETIADKLQLLIDNPKLRLEMGMEGRRRFLKYYTVEKYRELLGQVFVEIGNS